MSERILAIDVPKGGSVVIGSGPDRVVIEFLKRDGTNARLGFCAGAGVKILRSELTGREATSEGAARYGR